MYVVQLSEVSTFLQMLITRFEDYIFFSFTLMMACVLIVLTKRLMIGGR